MEKSDSPERVEEREDRRLPFSLADSRTVNWAWESGRLRRGMARGEEVDGGMLAVGGLIFQPLETLFPLFLICLFYRGLSLSLSWQGLDRPVQWMENTSETGQLDQQDKLERTRQKTSRTKQGTCRDPLSAWKVFTSDATQAEAVTIGSSSLVTPRDRRKMTASPRWEAEENKSGNDRGQASGGRFREDLGETRRMDNAGSLTECK
jgi:hypothetical protein